MTDAERNAVIEGCAQAIERVWPLADFPFASENADIYRAQDAAVRTVLKVIRSLVGQREEQ